MRLPRPLVASHLQCVKIGAGHVEEGKRGTEGGTKWKGVGGGAREPKKPRFAARWVSKRKNKTKHTVSLFLKWYGPPPSRPRIDRSRNRGVVPGATKQAIAPPSFKELTLQPSWATPSSRHAHSLQAPPSFPRSGFSYLRGSDSLLPRGKAGKFWNSTC